MKRLAALGAVCVALVVLSTPFAPAQRPRRAPQNHGMHNAGAQQAAQRAAQQAANRAAAHQAAILYQQAMNQQASLSRQQLNAARLAAQKKASRTVTTQINSTVVVRPVVAAGKKRAVVAQPLVVSTQTTTTSVRPTGPGQAPVIRSDTRIRTTGAGRSPMVTRIIDTQRFDPRRNVNTFKETVTQNAIGKKGNVVQAVAPRQVTFTERVGVERGKLVVKDTWTGKASNPAFARLPVQMQLGQLENLMPYRLRYVNWPRLADLPGKNGTVQGTIRWPNGVEKINTQVVNQYDRAGRSKGTQIQVKDTFSAKTPALAKMTPQAQLDFLESISDPAWRYRYFDPRVYAPYRYRYGWTALDRLAAAPIWY